MKMNNQTVQVLIELDLTREEGELSDDEDVIVVSPPEVKKQAVSLEECRGRRDTSQFQDVVVGLDVGQSQRSAAAHADQRNAAKEPSKATRGGSSGGEKRTSSNKSSFDKKASTTSTRGQNRNSSRRADNHDSNITPPSPRQSSRSRESRVSISTSSPNTSGDSRRTHRSRSRDRERERVRGSRLPKSYKMSESYSRVRSRFWERRRTAGSSSSGTLRTRFHGSMNISPASGTRQRSKPSQSNTKTADLENLLPNFPLDAHPPPPPPSPPPPLPQSPPPVEPPPPLPPQYVRGKDHSPASASRRQNYNRRPYILPRAPKSPPGEVDDDYIDLLLEYKQIQKQLENIKKEEERAAKVLGESGEKEDSRCQESKDDAVEAGEPVLDDKSRVKDKENVSWGEMPPWRQRKVPSNMSATSASVSKDTGREKVVGEEDEELDELELRLAALASAAHVNSRGTQMNKLSISSEGNKDRKPILRQGLRKRVRSHSRHESSTSVSSHQQKRHRVEELRRERSRTDDRRRDEERRVEDEKRRDEERKREVQRILTIDNPEEQVERFLRLCWGRDASSSSFTSRPPWLSHRAYNHLRECEEDSYGDNYEVEEMDIDSTCSSPAIEVEMDGAGETQPPFVVDEYDPTNPALDLQQFMYPQDVEPSDLWHPAEIALPMPNFLPPRTPRIRDFTTTNSTLPANNLIDPREMYRNEDDGRVALTNEGEGDEEEVEEDEEALRTLLLNDLRKKKIAIKTKGMGRPRRRPRLTTNPAQKVKQHGYQTKVKIPTHDPVIISLGASSDSDSENEDKHQKGMVNRSSLASSIDQLLRDARQAVETKEKTTKSPTTPEALKQLPTEKQNEYKKLKEEIKRREQNRVQMASTGDKNLRKPRSGTNTPPGSTQVDKRLSGKTSSGTDTPPPAQTQEKKPVEKVVSHTEAPSYTVTPPPPVEAIQYKVEANGQNSASGPEDKPAESMVWTEEQVKDLAAKLATERVALEEDESVLMALKSQILKRRQTLTTARHKVQTLKEQLAAADRIVKANVQQIQRFTTQARNTKAEVDVKRGVVKKLEKEVMVAGSSVYGDGYRLQLPSIDKGSSPPSKTSDTILSKVTSSKPSIDSLAHEKQRLLRLEKLYAYKIQKLKEAQQGNSESVSKSETTPPEPKATPLDHAAKISSGKTQNQTPTKPDSILTKDKISLTDGPTNNDLDMVVVTPHRRRSLVDLSTTTKHKIVLDGAKQIDAEPVLEKLSEGDSISKSDDLVRNDTVIASKTPSSPGESKVNQDLNTDISLPGQLQLAKLSNIHLSSLSKIPTSGLSQMSMPSYDVSVSSWPTLKQVVCKLDGIGSLVPSKLPLSRWNKSTKHKGPLRVYSSSLLCFKSYRFSPYFRTKEKKSLTSLSYTNKLNAHAYMCKYSLHGKCNDDKCPWQHEADYALSQAEVLQDIVSYCPSLAGIKPDAPKAKLSQAIGNYTEKYSKQHTKLTHEKQCLLLVSKLNEHAKHVPPHQVVCEQREWRPAQKEVSPACLSSVEQDNRLQLPKQLEPYCDDEDNIIGETDVRYWMLASPEIEDMETAVLDSPQNVDLWLKLAYKKLHGAKSSKDGVDQALNVFAHALQANRNNSELWHHYLTMYSRRGDKSQLLKLSQQALKYCPTYAIYWKYLGFLPSYDEKVELCEKISNWLMEQKDMDVECRSHQLLEISLHQVALSIASGHIEKSVKLLKDLWKAGGVGKFARVRDSLMPQDLGVAVLSYIHLVEFRSLPPAIYNPSQGLHTPLVCKEVGLFGWKEKRAPRVAVATLEKLFRSAEEACCGEGMTEEQWKHIAHPLYTNWLHLLFCTQRFEPYKELCCRVLKRKPSCVVFWLHLAKNELRREGADEARKVLQEAAKSNPYSVELAYGAATFELSQGNSDASLEQLENAIINLFEVERTNPTQSDPNMLYSHVLGLPVPLCFIRPEFKPTVNSHVVQKERLYLWLSYCMLLDLQGDTDQMAEAYETALTSVKETPQLYSLWMSYLQMAKQQAMTCGPASQQRATATFYDLVHRCLISMPVRFPVPHMPQQTWLDYRFHSDVAELWVKMLPKDQVAGAYDHFIQRMPSSVQLICRACEEALRHGNRALARGLTTMALIDHPACLHLWKIHLRLSQWDGTYPEVKRIFQRALQQNPLVLHLWKEYLLYELVHGTQEAAADIVRQCRQLGLFINDYLNTVKGIAAS